MKRVLIIIAMIGMVAGAAHSYHKRNLLIQAAQYSEAFTLSEPIKFRVADYFVRYNQLPPTNELAGVGPAKSFYGTSVKQITIGQHGVVVVDFQDQFGQQSLLFTPSENALTGQVKWTCTSDSIDPKVLSLLKPHCHSSSPSIEQTLIFAVANNQTDQVRTLLDQGTDVNAAEMSTTPLMMAVRSGHVELAKELVAAGALVDFDGQYEQQQTPLMLAILLQDAHMTSYLLAQGAALNKRDNKGRSAADYAQLVDRKLGAHDFELMLMQASRPDSYDLPKMGAASSKTGPQRLAHMAQLHGQLETAAQSCHVQRIATLLKAENDYVKPERFNGLTLEDQTSRPQCKSTLRDFLKTKRTYQQALDARFDQAVSSCDVKDAESLLTDNPALDVTKPVQLYSHFDKAIHVGCARLVTLFIREKSLRGELEGSVLLKVVRKTPPNLQVQMVGALIEAGADVNFRDSDGGTPLAAAIALEQPVVAKLLIDAGAEVNTKTRNNSYPLIEASKKGYNHLAQHLIDSGANIHLIDSVGTSALIAAVAAGRDRLVTTLLLAGADVTHEDNNGLNALEFAESYKYKSIYRQLKANTKL